MQAFPPTAAPHSPVILDARTDGSGRVRVTWQAADPIGISNSSRIRGGAGVTFIVYRQDPGSSGPRVVGLTNELHYTDEDAPLVPGAPVLYMLQSLRAGKPSPMTMPVAIDLPVRTNHANTWPATTPAFHANQTERAA